MNVSDGFAAAATAVHPEKSSPRPAGADGGSMPLVNSRATFGQHDDRMPVGVATW